MTMQDEQNDDGREWGGVRYQMNGKLEMTRRWNCLLYIRAEHEDFTNNVINENIIKDNG